MSFIDDYIKYAVDLCDAPVVYHKFVARALVGLACRNRAYCQFGAARIFPNIWMILIGQSSLFRKTTSIDQGLQIMDKVDPHHRLPNEITPQALIPALANQPYGTLYFSEYRTLASFLDYDYMKASEPILTDFYDVPDYRSKKLSDKNTKREVFFEVRYPTISILSATTMDWFVESIKKGQIEGGYLPRYLIVLARSKERTGPPGILDMIKKNKLVAELQLIQKFVSDEADSDTSADKQMEIKFAPDAYTRYFRWLDTFETSFDHTQLITPFFSRLTIYALKFCIIEAVGAMSRTISLSNVEAAIETVGYVLDSLKDLQENELAFTDYEKMRKKVVDAIKQNPMGISQSKLTKKVRIHTRDLAELIGRLTRTGEIKVTSKKTELSDRPTIWYQFNENNMGLIQMPEIRQRIEA